MTDEVADCGADRDLLQKAMSSGIVQKIETYHSGPGNPVSVITQLVQGPDYLQQRIQSTLSDTLVVVAKQFSELQGTWLNVREEVAPGSVEKGSNGICCNLFFDCDGTVDIHKLVEVNIIELNAVLATVIGDGDSIRRGGARVKGICCFSNGDYN